MDTLVGAGYSLSDVWKMTPDQIELFARYASQRISEEYVQLATLTAIGTSVGFSGKDKPLKELAKSMGVETGRGGAAAGAIQEFAGRLAMAGKVKKEGGSGGNGEDQGPRQSKPTRIPRGSSGHSRG